MLSFDLHNEIECCSDVLYMTVYWNIIHMHSVYNVPCYTWAYSKLFCPVTGALVPGCINATAPEQDPDNNGSSANDENVFAGTRPDPSLSFMSEICM